MIKSNRPIIALDADGVIIDWPQEFFAFACQYFNIPHNKALLTSFTFDQVLPASRDEINTCIQIFNEKYPITTTPAIANALESIEELSQYANIAIVTARQDKHKDGTIAWFKTNNLDVDIHFSVAHSDMYVHDKSRKTKVEIIKNLNPICYVDDKPEECLYWPHSHIPIICYSQPYNTHVTSCQRLEWPSLKDHILENYLPTTS